MRTGRPPKPVEQLKLHGTFRKDRHANRENEPKATGIPVCPSNFAGEELKHWKTVMPELMNLGTAKAIDTSMLIALCECWGLYRQCHKLAKKDPIGKPLIAVSVYLKAWERFASAMGLSPISRARLRASVGEEKVSNGIATRERSG